MATEKADDSTLLSDDDLYLFNEGTHRKLADKLGAHPRLGRGTSFAVWAPNATGVAVIGDFNDWDRRADPLAPKGVSGIWQAHLSRANPGDIYKFAVTTREGEVLEKADPFAVLHRSSASDRLGGVGSRVPVERR